VNAAILSGGYLLRSNFKLCFRLIPWLEKYPATLAVSDYFYPLYVVLSLHWVGNIANLDDALIPVSHPNRESLDARDFSFK